MMGVGWHGGRGGPEGEAWLEEVEEVENASVEAESTIAQVCVCVLPCLGISSAAAAAARRLRKSRKKSWNNPEKSR